MRSLFLTNRFFGFFGGIAALSALSFPFEWPFPLTKLLLVVGLLFVAVDTFLLYSKRSLLSCQRFVGSALSLSDVNLVTLVVQNHSSTIPLTITAVDELPFQFQERHFAITAFLPAASRTTLRYELRPLMRGVYAFGHIHLFAQTSLGFIERRFTFRQPQEVPVYPSVIQMRQYELVALRGVSETAGIKKVRRLGHSYEFEQIKNYTEGDDYRSINWKASGRRGSLMVNQYEDERSQQLFCLLDKSRVMNMPFSGMSLLDYAINTTLTISNIALKKQDRVGLLSFSDVLGSTLPADRGARQLRKLLEALYRERERTGEANYELLYEAVRRLVHGRSLLLLFTNFESRYALERVLPLLRRLNHLHLLVVVFFENAEIRAIAEEKPRNTLDLFRQAVARQFLEEKEEIRRLLLQYGIQTLLTRPEDLSVNTINKYLELKARGLI